MAQEEIMAEEQLQMEETPQEEEPQEVSEETPPDEGAEEAQAEQPAEQDDQPSKPKQTAQERINEITRLRREAEREAEYWKSQAMKTTKPEPQEKPAVTPPTDLPQRPTIDQFETNEQYEDALFEWRDNINQINAAKARRQEEFQSALDQFNAKAHAMRKQHPDFDRVVENPVFTEPMRIAVLNSEIGPEIAYHLGLPENQETADRIRNLSPERQIYEVGKLETKLEIAKQTKKATAAPEPIEPVGMSGGGADVDPSKMTTEQWMEWDKKRRLERIKQGLA
jgi:hypothetical protein